MAESEKEAPDTQETAAVEEDTTPTVGSVFVIDPGLPEHMDAPWWKALPVTNDFTKLEGAADVEPSTEFCVAHDASALALYVRCEEPQMDALWSRRASESGRLDLDDSIEIALDPYHAHGFRWSIVIAPSGHWEAIIPVGACARPECQVEVKKLDDAWEALVRIPVVDVGLEGDLRGTPVNGDIWGLAVIRRRREATAGPDAGKREIAAWTAQPGAQLTAESLGHLRFEGGRDKKPAEFSKYAAGSFGVNEICVAFEGGKIPENLEVALKPAPAAKLRSKDASRYKFRVARPGLYRYQLRIPYAPPPEPTEEELAELEADAGRELTDDELAEHLAQRKGTPAYVAGLSFLLRDLWAEMEDMEDQVEALKRTLDEHGVTLNDARKKLFTEFEDTLNEVDRYRAPHIKARLGNELVEQLRAKFADVRGAAKGALLKAGKLSIASTYFPSGNWYLGVLRVRTTHSDGTEVAETIVPKLRAAGMSFVAFADRPEGGDQDGDGSHDYNGDGVASPAARTIEGSDITVREDRGREAYVRDYSKTAAEQDKGWVGENWKLSSDGEFVVLGAVETGSHYPALCLGVPVGGLPAGTADGYDQVARTQDAGGVAVMCEAPGDLRELPIELSQVVGIDAPPDAWERLMRSGRKLLLFPGTKLDGADLGGQALPERCGYVGVLAPELTQRAIVDALRRGSFYCTTGPRITGVEVKGDTVTIRTDEDCQIFFRGETGQVLSGAFGSEAEYRFTGREKHVRAVCLSDVLEDGFRLEATTQPFFLADDLPRSPIGSSDADWTIAERVDRSDEPDEDEAANEESDDAVAEGGDEEAAAEETGEEEEASSDDAGQSDEPEAAEAEAATEE